jgi:polysaccharide biosynthesis/export protein
MKLQHASFLWLLLLATVLAGCRSHGPRGGATGAAAASGNRLQSPKLAALDESAFSSVSLTNQIPPDWLHPATNFFRLGPGDSIAIEVFGDTAPAATVLVGPDGKIYYSLLPGLSVWNLTLTETKELLEKELSRFTRVKPEISVTLRAVGSKRFWMLGSVVTPGVYSLATPVTLLEAITLAGGPVLAPGSSSGMPDLRKSFVMRNGQSLPIDLNRLLASGDLSQNIYLRPDDFVYLKSATTRDVYVLGAVRRPMTLPYSEGLSVLSVLASAGGTIEFAQVSHIAVVRGSLTAPRIALVDYRAIYSGNARDVRLEEGDIVYVPFVPYRALAVLVQNLVRQFAVQITSNEGYRLIYPNAVPVAPNAPGAPAAAAP